MELWDRIGRFAAYAAALALAPYVVIKASWVLGSLVGALPIGAGFNTAGWVVLNTVTIGMAGAGILVALSLVRPWGLRVPGRPLALCAWVAVGFLVPMLPYAMLSSLFTHAADVKPKSSNEATMPGWEAALIEIGFVGMGLGLALGLPAYLRRRWPATFAGRVDPADPRRLRAAVLGTTAVGVFWLTWAVGSDLGVTHVGEADASWRVLYAVDGVWSLAAGAATYALWTRERTKTPRWLLVSAAWIGSGSLFAWSGWKLALTLYLMIARPADISLPENLAVAAVVHVVAIASGATSARALMRGVVLSSSPGPLEHSSPGPLEHSAP